ncbi:MAG: hypothetical protein JXN63_00600, partial [Candidatus Delongbacteria bacterium]|nr:hypothetical protein [Candidatus Delongbacteria bacterium]
MRRFKLALVLLILMINPVLYSQFVFGTGTEEDPYHITNPSELNSIRDFMTSYFTLDCDIDLALYLNEENEGYNNGEFWEPIGNSNNPFKGTIYGNAKRILNLKINRPDSIYIGLFGYADSCSVNDLSLEIDLESKIFGNELVGGLIGYCSNSSISKCSSVGTIEGETDTGGLIGYIKESTVTDCNAICTVTGWAGIGGLIGGNENGIINRCYSTGVIIETIGGYSIGGLVGLNDGYLFESFSNSDVEGESKIGGLVGINFGDSILNCYATGSVTGQTMGQDFGGLIGDNWGEVRNCYSTGVVTGGTNTGGFIGINSDGTVIDSYWDTETSG